jgi:hypothetical protein
LGEGGELGLGGGALFAEVGEAAAELAGPVPVEVWVAGGLVGLEFGDDVGLLAL